MPGAPREVHPNAQDISNAVSAGALLEQPIGLAYITAAPTFERSGPIRFKRSVSGNRYKPMAGEQSCLAPPGSKGGDYGGSGFDARLASPQQPPQQQQQQAVGELPLIAVCGRAAACSETLVSLGCEALAATKLLRWW